MADTSASLNADSRSGLLDGDKLKQALRAEGDDFLRAVQEGRPHLFAGAAFFISRAQMEQMQAVIAAVERVAALPAWRDMALQQMPEGMRQVCESKGVFMGYDFHLNADGAHLIEINTNAGGAFLNELLLRSQRDIGLPGEVAAQDDLERAFLDMFRNEWRLERGDAPLQCVAIVDEQPQTQYLYPEFQLAQRMFERAGIVALIADPSELEVRAGGLYCGGRRVDMVYNRLTDFFLQHHAVPGEAFQNRELAVITPHPYAYALYADKYNLTVMTSVGSLREMGAAEADIEVLQAGVPQARLVQAGDEEHWWQQRKQWFFKPVSGYGSKGGYNGAKLTKRVFGEILHGGYVAQRLAEPGERAMGAEGARLKSDVRCYVYDGQVQLVVARLYQGQTTNFRTESGGFAQVRVVQD